jgi:hypothetical protein
MASSTQDKSLHKAQPRQLLRRILTEPTLVEAVRALPAPALATLVRQVGLEDSGELLALASPAQLLGVFDEDLWKQAQAGDNETFDSERFALWLEILLEGGEDALAERLMQLPEEFVLMGLQGQIMVLDMDAVSSDVASMDRDDAAQVEKALESCLCEELENFRVISRRHEGWDAVLATLLALDKNHHQDLYRILDKLAKASDSVIDDYGGLCEALSAAEEIATDAEADREDRRAAQGYVSPPSARSFLGLCRQTPWESVLTEKGSDPITRAYFRELVTSTNADMRPEANRLMDLLHKTKNHHNKRKYLGNAQVTNRHALFRNAMKALAETSPKLQAQRSEELVFLMNVLMSGACKKYRSSDAALAVAAVCNLGLEQSGVSLESTSADKLFRIGYKILHDEVAMPAARFAYKLRLQSGSRGSAQMKKRIDAQEPWKLAEHINLPHLSKADRDALCALLGPLPSLIDTSGQPQAIESADQVKRAKKLLKSIAEAC